MVMKIFEQVLLMYDDSPTNYLHQIFLESLN